MENNNNYAVRYLIYLVDANDGSNQFIYRVIDVIIPGLVTQGVCDVETARCLSLVFPDSVSNFRIVDDRIVLGWSAESIRAMEELNKNLPSVYTIVGADDEAAHRIPDDYNDDDEEPWDADIPDEERITNPSVSTISMKVDDQDYDERFENWELPESTPGIGKPGFHWGM